MLKNKSSVRIVSTDGTSDKNLMVPTVLLKHWKKIGISTLSFIFILCGSIVYFATIKKEQDITNKYEATLDEVRAMNRQLSSDQDESARDIHQVKQSFNKIDSTLERINAKMKKRGLKTIALQNAGGPVELDEENIELLSEFYADALKELDRKLAGIPIGIPHPGKITSKFGYRRNPFTNRGREMHSGIDLKGRTGDPVKVTANGKVIFAGYEGAYGNVVKVDHPNGFQTRYAHLSKTKVKKGQNIEVGTVVGLLGNTGRSTGSHLHYEILQNNKKLNPEKYFNF
ncbi:M23 family peptidase [Sphingobacterium olei]|uniref:M23 family peptidase n=1 Tax=Sphingobacterium olei TaxID=2571155 RepID=A0A4U0PCR6_9SPHI|nr:M23 family metallopeptidase [Sphingobacterium olei]TJZ60444.1 M23 family peptidase [Sphingobacterium olei]